MTKNVNIKITADNSQASKALKSTSQDLDGLGKSAGFQTRVINGQTLSILRAVGGWGLLLAAVSETVSAVANFTKESVKAFSELEQNLGGAQAVWGEYANTIISLSEQAYRSMGASANEYLATANKMGALFKGSGQDSATALAMTTQAMQRTADVASVMGITTEEAMMSVAGMAKGNFTMMDNLGVAMTNASLEAYALEKGMSVNLETMDTASKVQLAFAMYMERTAYASGNFAREGVETLAGSVQVMNSAMNNAQATVGQAFGPALTALANIVTNYVAPAIEWLGKQLQALMSMLGLGGNYVRKYSDALTNTTTNATKSSKAVDSVTNSVKKLNGQLASFDEMNTLKTPSASSGGGTGGAISSPIDLSGYEALQTEIGEIDRIMITKPIEWSKGFDDLFDGFAKIGQSIVNISKKVTSNLAPQMEKFFKGLGTSANGAIELVGAVFDFIGTVFTQTEGILSGVVTMLVQPVATVYNMLGVVGEFLGNLMSNFADIFTTYSAVLDPIGAQEDLIADATNRVATAQQNVANAINQRKDAEIELMNVANEYEQAQRRQEEAQKRYDQATQNTTASIQDLRNRVMDGTLSIADMNEGEKELYLSSLQLEGANANLEKATKNVDTATQNVTDAMKAERERIIELRAEEVTQQAVMGITEGKFKTNEEAVEGMSDEIDRLSDEYGLSAEEAKKMRDKVAENLDKMDADIKGSGDSSENFRRGFENVARGVGNTFILLAEGILNMPINALNTMLKGFDDIIPGDQGWHIPTIKLPLMATGGVVSSATTAVIGEAGREAVLPLDQNTEWADILAEKISGSQSQHVTIKIGEETILDRVIDGINEMSALRNGSVINI